MYILLLIVSVAIAILFGKIMQLIKMPAILGWLIAGMALGEFGFNLISSEMTHLGWYHISLEIFESFVGVMIGSELIIRQLKKSGKQIIVIAIFEAFMTFAVVSFAFAIVLSLIGLPLYLALIFGAIGLATAPAPSLSIVNEYKAKGPVTNTLLPIVALDDIIAISVFLLVMTFVVNVYSTQALPLYLIAVLTIAPLLIGALYGYLSVKVMKIFNNRKSFLVSFIIFILLANFTGMFVNNNLLSKPLINFMLLGLSYSAVVFNLMEENEGHQLLEDFKPLLGIGLVVVILNLGAPLDFRLITQAGLYTAIYIIARALGKIGGSYLGAKVTDAPPTVRKFLGFTLLPHSGVSLIFTGIAYTVLSGINVEGATLIMSTITAAAVINELIAVVLAKKAFGWAKEI